jgi:CRISPR-associated protein Cas2
VDTAKFKVGWLIVAFDLPVGSKPQRKAAHDFREWLKDDGFQMLQWSVYARSCVSFSRQETHFQRVKARLPEEGSVRILFVTRAQWERSFVIHGKPAKPLDPEEIPQQMQFW